MLIKNVTAENYQQRLGLCFMKLEQAKWKANEYFEAMMIYCEGT